ncbi:MAG: ABC transporter permease, partial [Bacteroidota bacterium]
MLKNYLRTAWRNLLRSRAYTLINLLGLALGMASCLLIVLYVQHELGYDHFHEQKDRIYRISSDMSMGGNQDHYAMAGMAVGPALTELYPEVDTFTRFLYNSNRWTLRFADQVFKEERIYMADAQVFEVFSYPLSVEDPQTALARPHTMVLTESLAQKYFADEDPLGQRLQVDQSFYEITGVMEDLPANSDFSFQALLSMSTLPDPIAQAFSQDWGRVIFYTYLRFDKAASVVGFDQKLADFVADRVLPFWEENGVTGSMTYRLTPLTELHFRTDMSYDTPKGNISYLYIFAMVAVFILLIACFNYINLAIAQSARRSVEVGIRKATGASRGQLLGQFLGESLLLSLFALILAVLLVELALPTFNQIAGKSFTSVDVFSAPMMATMLGITLLTGLAAGSYPAIFLARLKPVTVLKRQLSLGGRHWLRRTLVVIQFSISIALIVGTLVIQDQMHFLQNRDLGFRQDQMLVIEVPFDSASQAGLPALRQELLQ